MALRRSTGPTSSISVTLDQLAIVMYQCKDEIKSPPEQNYSDVDGSSRVGKVNSLGHFVLTIEDSRRITVLF